LGIYQPCNSKTKKSLLNSQLIPKNRENPPPPNDLLSKGGRIADIKASAKASGKTTVCIVLKQRSNSGYYGQVCYLEKQMAHRDDLAVAYRLLLEQPILTGHFNTSA
jgi:hypothetical protein